MRESKNISNSGLTLIESLIALFISAVIMVAALQFYMSINQQSLSQQEISDIQQINRICLEELCTSLRSAGYNLSGHDAYKISNDSLYVFMAETNPVDTVLYYLQEFSDAEYASKTSGLVSGMTVYNLMKKINSNDPIIFADYITMLQYTVINSKLIAVTLEVQVSKADDTFDQNNGFRTFINTERAVIRNM